ncbi:DUF2946 family protein [Caulobacter sp. UNC358MFTsu5.1]|uniref:DUF2946 family protein n=1 Tax=Caulobacter sp. UNC358MFTsu5.1 TaxID=1449049 RepID=UPI0004A6E406|nr:DUF2946 family protein [Caulobacter sp. UNC358MFTsu5.1]
MSPRRAQSWDKSRTTWPIALLAMLALLVQALMPAAAMAHDAAGQSVMICTADGAKVEQVAGDVIGKKAPAPDSKGGFAGLPCAQCLAVALATTTPPDVAVAPVLYGVHVAPAPVAALTGVALARAPPRPPGQGPPTA